ncbi:Putative DNA-binding protein in cluster with Type I restriction-modification system [Pediococcus damnosus]|uniref:DNA-binding protein in cluster with Type I restriction-modification system n=1 Tax=Pediococcus damnosus TaxID=51663 RepID=A0A0R2HQ84_9LACO|nr:HTH domain-containing protein [Pediococcus damnosus]AMV60556.1 Putative DNA-binding protein in cluster with Type I restriction-modification system [Pediococcus damnosus]AMV62983.1 Putative DNA-binding protein in cluster with Type I restriction-modification system [Pediococcus damnosus]AMV64871.1 Putative DNA-binding protein in cluster with Type I restriction-modification system [Pediococcus damnosus]AMV67131.1 Putative DNA-binding protein in cluster with Type I restriction-modification syste
MNTEKANFLLYKTDNRAVSIDVIIGNKTIWATQKSIAELFGVNRTTINRHLKDIFETGELDKKVISAKSALNTQHGAIKGKTQSKLTNFYNLDAIISVGYRVNSI